MSTTLIDLLVIFAGIAAVALLLQLLLLIGLLRKFGALSASAMPMLQEAGRKLPELFRESGALLRDAHSTVTETRAKVETMTANLVEMTTLARAQVVRADELLDDVRGRVQAQVERADEALTGVITGFETISNAVQRTIVKPVNDVNALLRGVRTGLDFFFRRRSSPVPSRPDYEDEEMFI